MEMCPYNGCFVLNLNSPFVLAKKNSALLSKTEIYFDCGTEDRYGFNRGARKLDQTLTSPKIPHEFQFYGFPISAIAALD